MLSGPHLLLPFSVPHKEHGDEHRGGIIARLVEDNSDIPPAETLQPVISLRPHDVAAASTQGRLK